MTTARRAVLLGLSGADWSLLRPLLDDGRLPTLAALTAEGVHGSLRTLQPQFEPLLWTSIASGRRADAHRVLASRDDGGARPLSALSRQVHCLWHHLAGEKRRSLLVNWPVTYPAEPVHGVCVSELFFRLAGTPEGLEAPPPGSIHPAAITAELSALRISPAHLSAEELGFFAAELADSDPLLERLAVSLAEQLSVHAVSLSLLARDDWDLAMLRYHFLAGLGPQFMACHPPHLSWVPDEVFERYRTTMTHAAIYLDHLLGHVVRHLNADDLLVVFSERGMLADTQRPKTVEVAARAAGAPWYRDQGVLIIAGPGIDPAGGLFGANLLDLAPTLAHGLGLRIPHGLEGRVLVEAFRAGDSPAPARLPPPPLAARGGHPESRQLSEEEAALLKTFWRETEVDRSTGDEPGATTHSDLDRLFCLAVVHLDAGRPDRALPIWQHLHQERPDDERVMLHLARCFQATGKLDAARELLEQVVADPEIRPRELMELARLHLANDQPDHALACLFRAEQAEGERAPVHCRIGQVYLHLQRFDDAERAFTKALERDPDHPDSVLGMARTRLGQGRAGEAVDAALRAVELNPQPAAYHRYLGMMLEAADLREQAVTAFEAALARRPNDRVALQRLSHLLERAGRSEDAAMYAERLRRLDVVDQLSRSARESLRRQR